MSNVSPTPTSSSDVQRGDVHLRCADSPASGSELQCRRITIGLREISRIGPMDAHAASLRFPSRQAERAEVVMANVVLFMAMSLDGFIAGPDDNVSSPAGRGGERLFVWSDEGAVAKAVHAEYNATGAVLSGRRTYDLVNGWDGDHHNGVPMFILTHKPPAKVPHGKGTYTFVTDGVESAVAQAKAAAGDKDVLLHGADIAQQCLQAGLLDGMLIHLIPVLLGEGRRLFDDLSPEHIELEVVRVREAPVATHIRYR